MDSTYVICTLIFVSSGYVLSRVDEDNTGQFQGREAYQEESQLETQSDENNNQPSTLDSGASAGASPNYINHDAASEEYGSYEDTEGADLGNVRGSGKKLVIYQWRNGIVPYYIDMNSYDDVIYHRIRKAFDAFESASCAKFKPIGPKMVDTFEHSFIHFTNPNKERECVHTVSNGRRGEPVVVLGYDCMQERDIIHSIMHALGFRDEVTHPLRDSFIRIVWNNIQPKYRHLFTIDNKPSVIHKLAEYDTLSVMHFHDRAFSINGGPTILPLLPNRIINPSDKLSLLDKMKLRIAFAIECKRRQVDILVQTCKDHAEGGKFLKDNVAEDQCAFDKFKVTTVSGNVGESKRQSGNDVVEKDRDRNATHDKNKLCFFFRNCNRGKWGRFVHREHSYNGHNWNMDHGGAFVLVYVVPTHTHNITAE